MKLSIRKPEKKRVEYSLENPPPAYPASPPDPGPRPLGSSDRGECLPDHWPEGQPEKEWEDARHTPETQTGIVLSTCGKWAWLAILSPLSPGPLLLHRWPVTGKLTKECGGLATMAEVPEWIIQHVRKFLRDDQEILHSLTSPGINPGEEPPPCAPRGSAGGAGCDTAKPCRKRTARAATKNYSPDHIESHPE